MGERAVLAAVLLAVSGCGTYSTVRPADTLPRGRGEIAAGLASSSLGEVNTIVHAAYGATERVELLGQNEIWNSFVEVRYGILKSTRGDPVALAVGLGGGQAVTLISALTDSGEHETVDGAAGTASVAVGYDWGRAALTLANRTFVLSGDYLASSTRVAARIRAAERFGVFVEAGATVHAPLGGGGAVSIAEAALGFWIGL